MAYISIETGCPEAYYFWCTHITIERALNFLNSFCALCFPLLVGLALFRSVSYIAVRQSRQCASDQHIPTCIPTPKQICCYCHHILCRRSQSISGTLYCSTILCLFKSWSSRFLPSLVLHRDSPPKLQIF